MPRSVRMTSPKIKFDLQIKYASEYGPEEEQAVVNDARRLLNAAGDLARAALRVTAPYVDHLACRGVSVADAALDRLEGDHAVLDLADGGVKAPASLGDQHDVAGPDVLEPHSQASLRHGVRGPCHRGWLSCR